MIMNTFTIMNNTNNKFLNLVQKQLSNGFNNSSISLNMKQILNHPKNEIIFCFQIQNFHDFSILDYIVIA